MHRMITAHADDKTPAPTTAELAALSPEQIDEILAGHYDKHARAQAWRTAVIERIQRALMSLDPASRSLRCRAISVAELQSAAVTAATKHGRGPVTAQIERALAELPEADAAVDAARAAAAPFDSEFDRRGGWTRAFLVVGSGVGHVHSTMHCSTCNRGVSATEFEWVTEFSGRDQAAIIEAAGWRACTVCYPDAPVGTPDTLPSAMLSRQDRDRQAAANQRAAERAQRLADRIAKGLTADGSPFVVTVPGVSGRLSREEFKTERGAISWVVGRLADEQAYDFPAAKYADAIDAIVAAISIKHDRPITEVRGDIDRKVKAAVRRRL